MIEIQCTSCHTRYRIDERVLPAESPTFKCSRCGHVFTADTVAAKKAAEVSSKPEDSRASTPPTGPKQNVAPPATSTPKAPAQAPKPGAPVEQTVAAKQPASESKPAPLKPYIRNHQPTDRAPEAPSAKQSTEPSSVVDAAAVSRMRESMGAPKSSAGADTPPRASEPPRPAPPRSQNNEADRERENLEFDFNDESEPELGAQSDDDRAAQPERWSVGDDALETPSARQSGFGSGEPDPEFSRGEPAPIGRGTIPQYAGQPPVQRSPLPDERAYIERAALHSARSFIGLFFVVALVFVALTLVIYGIPSASAELLRRMPVIGPEFVQTTPLENLVSVSDVQSDYQSVKGGHHALVVTGVVKNNSTIPLHTVQIGVRLLDASQHEIASSAVYVGTTLSPRMIGEMTPHELEFLQKLDPQKSFVLEASHAVPFLMVFIDPPRDLSHFAIAVSKAQPAVAMQSGAQASAHE